MKIGNLRICVRTNRLVKRLKGLTRILRALKSTIMRVDARAIADKINFGLTPGLGRVNLITLGRISISVWSKCTTALRCVRKSRLSWHSREVSGPEYRAQVRRAAL